LRDHYALTRAELQRFFGLDLGRMGRDFTPIHAAYCLQALPLGSRLLATLDPSLGWTVTDYKLHDILCALVGHVVPYPWSEEAHRSTSPGLPEFAALDAADFERIRKQKLQPLERG
jgi:hypothetical protein